MSDEPPANASEAIRVRLCPMCQRPTDLAFRPFCSKRCADVDLSRWLKGVYAIPAREDEEEDDEGEKRG